MRIICITPIDHIPGIMDRLKALGEFIYEPNIDPEKLSQLLKLEPSYIFTNPNKMIFRLDRKVLGKSPVRAISTASTGRNHIDLDYCAVRNIQVYSLTEDRETINKISSTAEHAFGLMLALLRHIPASFDSVKQGDWDYLPFVGRQLNQLTAGVVGFGRLGKKFAGYCGSFGMKVIMCDPKAKHKRIPQLPLEEVLDQSDVVSLHVHLERKTTGMINEQSVNGSSPFYLINTSRGGIVNEPDVIEMLRSKRILGYATDVVASELGEQGDILSHLDEGLNLIVTPHIGGMTIDAQKIAYSRAVDYLEEHMKNHIATWKKLNNRGYQNQIANTAKLHRNSEELTAVLKRFELLNDGATIFEIGCGSGRNLDWFLRENPKIVVKGNDLIQEKCEMHMAKIVKDCIEFLEIDTLSLFRDHKFDVDVLVSSDHLMHIHPDSISEILELIKTKWKPPWILMRESKIDRLNGGKKSVAKYNHNYGALLENYSVVRAFNSKGDKNFSVNLYRHEGISFEHYDIHRERHGIEVQACADLCKGVKTIFDIGANIGIYSILFSRRFPDANIYAFEPVPENFEVLQWNTKNVDNIHIYNLAFGKNEIVTLRYPSSREEDFETNKGLYSTVHKGSHPIQANSCRLDSWCEENNIYPDLIKIDVEGAERIIIENGTTCLSKANYILIESSDWADIFSKRGFKMRRLVKDWLGIRK